MCFYSLAVGKDGSQYGAAGYYGNGIKGKKEAGCGRGISWFFLHEQRTVLCFSVFRCVLIVQCASCSRVSCDVFLSPSLQVDFRASEVWPSVTFVVFSLPSSLLVFFIDVHVCDCSFVCLCWSGAFCCCCLLLSLCVRVCVLCFLLGFVNFENFLWPFLVSVSN